MAEPTDDEIAAWADGFIKQNAYNRAVAVQIAAEAAKWVRGQRVQVGWYYESPATGGSGLRLRMSDAELAEWRRLAHVWPVYRTEREAVPRIDGVLVGDGSGKALPPVSHEERTAAGLRLPAVQDGWRVVPIEPTPEMLAALNEWAQCIGYIDKGYSAMLLAAPQPRGVNGGAK